MLYGLYACTHLLLVTLVDNVTVVLRNQVHSVAGADLTGVSRETGGKKRTKKGRWAHNFQKAITAR